MECTVHHHLAPRMPRNLLLNRTEAERLLLKRPRHRRRANDPHHQRAAPRTTPMTGGTLITLAAIVVVLALTTALVVTSNGGRTGARRERARIKCCRNRADCRVLWRFPTARPPSTNLM